MGNTNTTEPNDKPGAVDGVSGAGDSPDQNQTAPKSPGRNVDGIIRSPALSHNKLHVKVQPAVSLKPTPPVVAAAEVPKPKPAGQTHPVHHLSRHQPEHTKTLMRSAVHKPEPSSLKAKLQLLTPLPSTSIANVKHQLPTNHHDLDVSRLTRAQAANKSTAITRFGEPEHNKFVTHLRPLAVKAAPPVESTRSAPFDSAIANATSHQQASPKRLRLSSRLVNVTAAALAVLLIGGFIAYQNAPNIDLRLISSRAGFSATMPGFKPPGFGVTTPIKYSAGEVTLSFRSASDSRSFSVVEQQSNWDSQTLLDNFVVNSGQSYQTVQNAGRIIYVYAGNATWVNGNIWYRITGNAGLSSSQLVNIATSM